MKIILGIDPDSKAHGVAIYIDGKLVDLCQWSLGVIIDFCLTKKDILVSIEDVKSNKFIYTRNIKQNKNVQNTVAISVGKCQQSQIELERELDRKGIPYKNFKPQKGNWADDKSKFEMVTGWSKRSNSDTRSAAYFGYLAL